MKSKLYIFIVILLFSTQISAQSIIFFKPVSFGKPFVSDTRSPITKLSTIYLNKISEYYYKSEVSKRPFIEARFGYGIPLMAYHTKNTSIALNMQGGAVTLVDMFEPETAPVINTDYWFGGEIKMIKRFSRQSFLKNISVKLLPMFHESTHIGDEFAMHGYSQIPNFKRINVSYEAWKLSLCLNDPDTLSGNILSLKVGIQSLWGTRDGYYVTDSYEVKNAKIPSSKKKTEWYFSGNYQRTKGFLCSEKFVNILSAEINNRPKFSYNANIPESRVWSFNVFFGWQYKISDKAFRNVGFFLQYYSGLNPHGQFRNETAWRATGISIVLM